MKLSVIIVSYNVRFFLEQCLHAVQKAAQHIDAEIIVADNHSADGSVDYLQPLFPQVRFICNDSNEGFARANNLALTYCRGEYVLLLNPDTLVPGDCFAKCLQYMEEHPRVAAIGVKMLDGKGNFLPESKRAFPSVAASFYKLTGLAALFPRSPVFNRYALGHLDNGRHHEVDVLAGAFFFCRRAVLNSIGGFDERFFLYGEDIDLSYRIKQAGWQNHYFAGTAIIHFKGESSDCARLDQVKFFYQAMQVFVKKHYDSGKAKWFSRLISVAIFIRGSLSILSRFLSPVLVPLLDSLLLWLSLQAIKDIWIWRIRDGLDFNVGFVPYAIPLFSFVFVLAAALAGLYDRAYRFSRAMVAVSFAVVCMLALYAMLPEQIRFSRGVILLGGLLGGVGVLLFRKCFPGAFVPGNELREGQTLIAGDALSYEEALAILQLSLQDDEVVGRIGLDSGEPGTICSVHELPALVKVLPVRRIIFCEGMLTVSTIIALMGSVSRKDTSLLFHMRGSRSIVGSDTPSATGTTVSGLIEYRLSQPYNRRMKRVVDMFLSLLILLSVPLHLLLHKHGTGLLRNASLVFLGHNTWVGYLSGHTDPVLPEAIIPHTGNTLVAGTDAAQKADRLYAKNYDWWYDIVVFFRNYQGLA